MNLTLLGLCISATGGPHFQHDPGIVALSYFVAILGCYAALDMTERLNSASAPAAYFWLLGSAVTLGGSLWAMHFIGILAVRRLFPMDYDPVLTTISFMVAVIACGAGLAIMHETRSVGWRRLICAGGTVGLGVAAMHYTGMQALELPGTLSYTPGLFCLSIVIAISAATAALWLSRNIQRSWQRALAAFVMAAAICGMHYTGMAATVMHFGPMMAGDSSFSRSPMTLAIASVTLALLALAIVCNAADRSKTTAAQRETAILLASTREIVNRLCAAGEFRDDDTGNHVIRLARVAARLAERAGTGEVFAKRVLEAAPLHDIGKIGIPDSILLKPGPLTEAERVRMQTHTFIGHDLLNGSGMPLLDFAAEIALTHHEKWDGSGYPNGLWGETIPLSGRIVAIADVFDALLSKRPYKDAWSADAVREYLYQHSGQHFDPQLIQVFLSHFPEMLWVRDGVTEQGPTTESAFVVDSVKADFSGARSRIGQSFTRRFRV